ncbi:MAG: hypothetical protein HKN47_16755 [Pirellulaceae bacterium]|nr:hypothetical protein [Pirellulaceae bacterium]
MTIRGGSAPLEFIIVLVPVLILIVMLFWMGAVGTNQTIAVVEARYDAWSQRDDQKAAPFEMGDLNQGLVTGEFENPIDVSQRVNDLIVPKSTHAVYCGAWQHPHIDLNRPPHWNLYVKVAEESGKGKAGQVANLWTSFRNFPREMQNAINSAVKEALASLDPTGLLGNLKSSVNEATAAIRKKKQEVIDAAKKRIADEVADAKDKLSEFEAGKEELERELENAKEFVADKTPDLNELRDKLKAEKDKDEPDDDVVENLEGQIESLREEIEEKQLEREDLGKRLNAAKKSIATANESIKTLEQKAREIEQIESKMGSIEQDLQSLEKMIDA